MVALALLIPLSLSLLLPLTSADDTGIDPIFLNAPLPIFNPSPGGSGGSGGSPSANAACAGIYTVLNVCESISPSFDSAPATDQASCACYGTKTNDPQALTWLPNLFDGVLSSCVDYLETANTALLPTYTPFLGFCGSVGDVRATAGGAAATTAGGAAVTGGGAAQATARATTTQVVVSSTTGGLTGDTTTPVATTTGKGGSTGQGTSAGVRIKSLPYWAMGVIAAIMLLL